jgi:hypothetical protein
MTSFYRCADEGRVKTRFEPFIAASCVKAYNRGMGRLAGVAGVVLCLALLFPAVSRAQDADVPASGRLRVYLDCDCYRDFLRSEIQWVDFVRQREDADVQVISSENRTGGGGREMALRFVGLGRFAGVTEELRVVSIAADPDEVTRRRVRDAVTAELFSLLAREGRAGDLSLTARDLDTGSVRQSSADRWNAWVFRISGDARIQSEETKREANWSFDATADRITENWKVSFRAGFDQQHETFDLDESAPLDVTRRERRFDWFLAKGLGQHWSAGVDGEAESSTFGNVQFRTEVMPAIEFNVFPYSQYVTRQLRLEYAIGAEHARYNEVTLFGRLRETRPRHKLSVTLDQRQPWGSLRAGAEWSQYLHDFSRSRLEVDGDLSVRLTRGLSVEIEGSASRVRDQLSLPRRDATPEEVLLQLRQLQSGHEVELRVGFSYSFGSILNNVVNPRFGD